MFIISSSYTRPIDDKAPVTEHLGFVQARHEDGTFVASGPRPSFEGGVIVARGDDESEIRAIMASDPFIREGFVDDYDYMQFRATTAAHIDLIDP